MARADAALERHRAGEYLGAWQFGYMGDGEEEEREKDRLRREEDEKSFKARLKHLCLSSDICITRATQARAEQSRGL